MAAMASQPYYLYVAYDVINGVCRINVAHLLNKRNGSCANCAGNVKAGNGVMCMSWRMWRSESSNAAFQWRVVAYVSTNVVNVAYGLRKCHGVALMAAL